MKIYHWLSQIKFLSKYSYKFLFVAFLGIHIPLIGILLFILIGNPGEIEKTQILFWILIFTLIATGITLYILNHLLVPLKLSKVALENYVKSRSLPVIPVTYKDEAGVLMQKVHSTLLSMDEFVQTKNDVIDLISHDLRSPINRNLGLIELALSENSDPEIGSYLEMIKTETQKQISLLGYLLEQLKREEIEIQEDQKVSLPLRDIVQEKLESLSHLIAEKRLKFDLKIPENFKVKVEKELFSQVIQNLIHNAVKFSNEDQQITIAAAYISNFVEISIIDQGIGFSPSSTEKLFQRFTELGRKGTAGEESHGIGLYLSRRIIERHSGSLRGISEGQNKGATFTIKLPR